MLSNECTECLLKENKINQKLQEQKRVSDIKSTKKGMFVSRGWGAGGMPFSALYFSPPHPSKAPAIQTARKPSATTTQKPKHKNVPQVRNSLRRKFKIVPPVLPQLFVSFGWGPHGKK